MKETFGQRFTRLRKEKVLTQEDIALKVNISTQAVSKWENDISMPDIAILGDLADILAISIDELLGKTKPTVSLSTNENKDINKMALKIKMLSSDGGKVNINLPIPLIKACIETGMQLPLVNSNTKLSEIDFSQIYELIKQGVIGELVSVINAEGDTISIIVE